MEGNGKERKKLNVKERKKKGNGKVIGEKKGKKFEGKQMRNKSGAGNAKCKINRIRHLEKPVHLTKYSI